MPDHSIGTWAEGRSSSWHRGLHRNRRAHPERRHHCEACRCARGFCAVARIWDRELNSRHKRKLRCDGSALAGRAHRSRTYQSGAGSHGRVESAKPFPDRERRPSWRRYHRNARQSPRSVSGVARLRSRADGTTSAAAFGPVGCGFRLGLPPARASASVSSAPMGWTVGRFARFPSLGLCPLRLDRARTLGHCAPAETTRHSWLHPSSPSPLQDARASAGSPSAP